MEEQLFNLVLRATCSHKRHGSFLQVESKTRELFDRGSSETSLNREVASAPSPTLPGSPFCIEVHIDTMAIAMHARPLLETHDNDATTLATVDCTGGDRTRSYSK